MPATTFTEAGPAVTTEQVARLYERAADRLGIVGWQKEADGPEDGPNCVNGAMKWAIFGDEQTYNHGATSEFLLLNSAYSLLGEVLDQPLIDWNDYECGSESEAVGLLRHAAFQLRSGAVTLP